MAQATSNLGQQPVTIMWSWTVKPGKEELFGKMMHNIHKVARTFPGHMGVTTLQSPTKQDNFETILRFDTVPHLENWLNSDIRQKMIKPLSEIAHEETVSKSTGLETWFELPGHATAPPPRWKMVIATFLAIYPLSLIYAYFVVPDTIDWPTAARALILPIFAPLILTYLFMPFLTQRVLKRWLYKETRA
jgi:antibiotic biosynthesis monooxygenase (ABM) superfamily enzyme